MSPIWRKAAVSSLKTTPVFLALLLGFSAVVVVLQVVQGEPLRLLDIGKVVLAMAALIVPMYVTVIAAVHAVLEVEDLA